MASNPKKQSETWPALAVRPGTSIMASVKERAIKVKVIPGAKVNKLKEEDGSLKIYLTAPAVDGKANKALIAFLAEHLGVAKGRVQITKGLQSRHKIINITSI